MKIRILTVAVILFATMALSGAVADRTYLNAALQAAKWIRSSAIRTGKGIAWPADPHDAKTVNTSLYSGSPGVILFFLEAYRSTGDRSFLKDARAGADHLLASLESEKETGLYEGVAGIGFTLAETFKGAGDEKYRQGAIRCAQLLRERAVATGRGVAWNETTDIISGGSGTGLFLLYAARELKEPAALETAVKAGERLIELGRPENVGINWAMNPRFPRRMPNFSHGTAGVAYFLATLYAETKRKEFLDAALAGAKYLQSVANTEGAGCLIFHHEPGGKDLYYLGWCHGPVGTARLFYRLHQVTGDREWMEWVEKSARSVIESGIPEKQTPGFWNNVSQCCGSAGVAEFFLNLHRVTDKPEYLTYAKRVAAQLLAKATRESNGTKWIQAEHRVKPDLLVAQTGYNQGAAGIGMWLLHLDAFLRGKKGRIVFPDSPF
ncbi:MAG: lanthionine synthetase LanC family protein [Blastocatellia bacterium]